MKIEAVPYEELVFTIKEWKDYGLTFGKMSLIYIMNYFIILKSKTF